MFFQLASYMFPGVKSGNVLSLNMKLLFVAGYLSSFCFAQSFRIKSDLVEERAMDLVLRLT